MRHTCLLVAVLALPAIAEADGLAGRWIMGRSTVSANRTRHEGLCPSAPPGEPGRTIEVREVGGELSFALPSGTRTTADCWTDNRAVRRRAHGKGPPRWSTRCATGADDPRMEQGTYTFSLSEDGTTLQMSLETRYAISVAGSECEGRFTVRRSLRKADAPAKVAEEPSGNRCRSPGTPATLDLPARRRVAEGSRVCLSARLRDRDGCETESVVSWEIAAGDAEVDSRGCVRVPDGAAPGTRIRVSAQAGELRGATVLEVATGDVDEDVEDTSGLLASDTVRRGESRDSSAAGGEGAGGVRALQPAPSDGSALLWPILIIAAILLVVLAMVLLLVVRTQRTEEKPAAPPPEPQTGKRIVASARSSGEVEGPVVCPTCREEFVADSQFCPYDATRLVPAGTEPERPTLGAFCPRCHRGYDVGTVKCPVDGVELVSQPIQHIARQRHQSGGESAKICPTCSARYGADATFCGKDGSELVLVN